MLMGTGLENDMTAESKARDKAWAAYAEALTAYDKAQEG